MVASNDVTLVEDPKLNGGLAQTMGQTGRHQENLGLRRNVPATQISGGPDASLRSCIHGKVLSELGERFGSGVGERVASMTRQIAFEPLPASVLLGCWFILEAVGMPEARYRMNPPASSPRNSRDQKAERANHPDADSSLFCGIQRGCQSHPSQTE